jgi:hypothetical protein
VWVLLFVLLVASLSTNVSELDAQGPNQVGLIVRSEDGDVLTRCVEFGEAEISGYDILERAGLEVVRRADGIGGIVCSIQGVGCPVDDCWCQCKGSTCTYWSYWHLAGAQWSYSTLGADAHRVHNGDVEGWNWGEEEPPPVVPFEQICAPPATATLEPTATPAPTETPTNTPVPPPSINFGASRTTIVAGECVELNWQVEHVRAVYLDGNGVGGNGTHSACPAQTQTYELRVVSASGESRHPVTINVVQPTQTPTSTPTQPPPPTATPVPQTQPAATATAAPTESSAAPQTSAAETDVATETPASTATPTLTVTASPTVVVPTATATVPTATATVTLTPTPRPVAQLPRTSPTPTGGAAARPTPTPNDGLGAPGTGGPTAEETTNYVIFGVLMAVLVGVGAVILIQKRR